jgi:hypothetical protein
MVIAGIIFRTAIPFPIHALVPGGDAVHIYVVYGIGALLGKMLFPAGQVVNTSEIYTRKSYHFYTMLQEWIETDQLEDR